MVPSASFLSNNSKTPRSTMAIVFHMGNARGVELQEINGVIARVNIISNIYRGEVSAYLLANAMMVVVQSCGMMIASRVVLQ